MALISNKHFVVKSNLDTDKGIKLDESAKKISINIDETNLKFSEGKITFTDAVTTKLNDSNTKGMKAVKTLAIEGDKLKLTLQDDTVQEADLSKYVNATDKFLSTASYDTETHMLKLTVNDEEKQVDLSSLATKPVTLSTTDNFITQESDGLKVMRPDVELQDAFGEVIGYAYSKKEPSA